MDQGRNKGVGGKRENARSVRQMTNIKRRKSNETRSVSQCGEIMVEDEGMRSKQGGGNTGTELARRRTQVASPRDPDTLICRRQRGRATMVDRTIGL